MARRRKSLLNDLVRFQIKALASFGFSHRYIASLVFLKPLSRVTSAELTCVQGFCQRQEIRVSDWRNGKTTRAEQFATRGMKPPRRRRRRRRRGQMRRAA